MYVQVLNLTNMEPKVCHIMLWIYDIIENNLIIMGDEQGKDLEEFFQSTAGTQISDLSGFMPSCLLHNFPFLCC